MKPIIFSTPMVRAIVAGVKTQTRRVTEKQRYEIGDVLYVREAFHPANLCHWPDLPNTKYVDKDGYDVWAFYRAHFDRCVTWSWKPSIHMPKAAARLFLKVTDVRRQHLQKITVGDIYAEGVTTFPHQSYRAEIHRIWIKLWDSINAKRGFGWESNPLVWAYTFEEYERL